MRLVHLSDLHLGFRQYQRLTPEGTNQREADVELACTRAIERTIALAPEIVLVAGDVFHSARPGNHAILHAFRSLRRLRDALPDAFVVCIAGNHDAPRAADTGRILRLFTELGIEVADEAVRTVANDRLDVAVTAVPHDRAHRRAPWVPATRHRRQLLLLHGEVEGVIPDDGPAGERTRTPIAMDAVRDDAWDYVALGHYHVFRQLAARVAYSGSLDYTSTNPWADLRDERRRGVAGKGIVSFDIDTHAIDFHPIESPRRFVALPPIDAHGLAPAELSRALEAAADEAAASLGDALRETVVRATLRDVPPHVTRELDATLLRRLRHETFHFVLDARRPERKVTRRASGAPTRRQTLQDIVESRFRERAIAPGIDRDAFVRLGLGYLRTAEERTLEALPAPGE